MKANSILSLIFLFVFSLYGEANIPKIETLSIEEKVGQLLMVHFNGEEANQNAKQLMEEARVGGFIFYNWANGLNHPQQVQKLSVGLQKLAQSIPPSIPVLIAVDQEGGAVARLKNGFTTFPSNGVVGFTDKPECAEKIALVIGNELKAVGINMNLAPVVDVNSNPLSPIIRMRSFSHSPEKVALFAKYALQGYHRAGIITSLKHFPGHGAATVDSHLDLPYVSKSKEELIQTELFPFAELVPFADTIMTAHLMMPAFDEKHCATLSKTILEDILRKQLGYKGIIITDSLIMQGLIKNCPSIDDAAVQAIQAGCDIILLGGKQLQGEAAEFELSIADIIRIHHHIVNAVKNGVISEERLNSSVKKVLELKLKYALSFENLPNEKDLIKMEMAQSDRKDNDKWWNQ